MELTVLRTVVSLSSTVWQVRSRSILVEGKGKVVERVTIFNSPKRQGDDDAIRI